MNITFIFAVVTPIQYQHDSNESNQISLADDLTIGALVTPPIAGLGVSEPIPSISLFFRYFIIVKKNLAGNIFDSCRQS